MLKRLLIIGLFGIAICATLSFSLFLFVRNLPPPEAPALQQTALIVEAAKVQQQMPDGFPFLTEECWSLLRTALRSNQNHYHLVVAGVLGEYGTPTPYGATEVFIEVVFPDGERVQMYFYDSMFEACRGLTVP